MGQKGEKKGDKKGGKKGKKRSKDRKGKRVGTPPVERPDQGVWNAAELATYEPAPSQESPPDAVEKVSTPSWDLPGETALDSWLKLIRAAETLKSRLAKGLAPHKLTVGQFGVLEALLHLGPLCQKDLAEKLQVSGGNMTTVIDNLERRGLVRRERSTRDRRFISVILTETGTHLIGEVFPEQAEAITEDMSALDRKQATALGELCRSVGLSIQLK